MSLLNIRAPSFYSLVCRGYIRKVSVQLVPKYFSRDCSTDSFSCSKQKNRKKTRLKQGRKSGKEYQNVVVVANPPGSSSLHCRTAIALLSHRYRYAVALLLLCCCTAIALVLLRCCRSCCRYAVALLSLICRTVVDPICPQALAR